jgi:hypothetical protein
MFRSHYEGKMESAGVKVLRVEGPIEAPTGAVYTWILQGRNHVEVGRWKPRVYR